MESRKIGNGRGAPWPQQSPGLGEGAGRGQRSSPSRRPSSEASSELLDLPRRTSTATQAKRPNLSKSDKLAYVVAEAGGGYRKYRKEMDKPVFRPSPLSGKEPVDVPAYGKGALFQSGRIHETITLAARPTQGRLSYRLKVGQLMKVLGWGKGPIDEAYPLAAGTSRPNVPVMTDGMAICSAIVVGATTPDGSKAKLKVFHIQPEMNPKGFEAVEAYVSRLKALDMTEMTVAMHGGNQYAPEKEQERRQEKDVASKLRALFEQDGINARVELDELAEAREKKDTPLGGVIEQINAEGEPPRYGIRIFNEVVGAPHGDEPGSA